MLPNGYTCKCDPARPAAAAMRLRIDYATHHQLTDLCHLYGQDESATVAALIAREHAAQFPTGKKEPA